MISNLNPKIDIFDLCAQRRENLLNYDRQSGPLPCGTSHTIGIRTTICVKQQYADIIYNALLWKYSKFNVQVYDDVYLIFLLNTLVYTRYVNLSADKVVFKHVGEFKQKMIIFHSHLILIQAVARRTEQIRLFVPTFFYAQTLAKPLILYYFFNLITTYIFLSIRVKMQFNKLPYILILYRI